MGLLSSCVHKVSQKRNLVNNRLYQRQTVRCQSNGNRASSVSDPPAPASRGQLCCRAGLTAPSYLHPWPVYPSTHPHLLLFSGDGSLNQSTLILSIAWVATAVSSRAPCRPLPRPRRRPPPWCSRRGLVNVVNDRHASEVDCTWRG